jgi:hypothetical protein
MKLMRGIVLLLAVMLPATWTLAHAAEEGAAGYGETKEGKSAKKKGKKKDKKQGGEAGSSGESK